MGDVQEIAVSGEEMELERVIVAVRNLDISPECIVPEAPLYGDGLVLDSVDMLEATLGVSRYFGFQLRSDCGEDMLISSSPRSPNQHIQSHRTA
ncbi:MAG: phosphopantetheine-binding protein [Gammaproteobacteria bacterium]|nr:phosphopantetheine-binding protein [Gammaproteobacteria bacterium]